MIEQRPRFGSELRTDATSDLERTTEPVVAPQNGLAAVVVLDEVEHHAALTLPALAAISVVAFDLIAAGQAQAHDEAPARARAFSIARAVSSVPFPRTSTGRAAGSRVWPGHWGMPSNPAA